MEAGSSAGHRHRNFIAANWETLAALAWRGFLRSGRGSLRLNERIFRDSLPGDPLLARVHCATGGRGPEAELVQGYDPEREIVCTVTCADGFTAKTYQLRGPLAPPEAYQREVDSANQEA